MYKQKVVHTCTVLGCQEEAVQNTCLHCLHFGSLLQIAGFQCVWKEEAAMDE